MNNSLIKEFEAFEGLGAQVVDESMFETKDEDDSAFQPANVATLSSGDIYYELEKRGLKSTGFPDTDKEMLQRAFDAEFKNDLEDMRAKRKEKQRKAAQQAGLMKRRLAMEKMLQEEQDELARNHQVSMMIDLIKENMVDSKLRMEVNSINARSLAKAMWANDTVTCLDLSSNQLSDHSGSYLARILQKNSTLKKIELDNNMLGPKSCIAFGESLTTNTSLIYLSLDSNPLSTGNDISGIEALSNAVKVNKTLTSLNLWRTGISAIGGSILSNAMEQNTSILICDISHNDIKMSDTRRIVDQLDRNLLAFEEYERKGREDMRTEAEIEAEKRRKEEDEAKAQELRKWLDERRDDRAENRRGAEERRIAQMQEEMEEMKRLMDIKAAEEKKAAEELAAKKAKKAAKKKK